MRLSAITAAFAVIAAVALVAAPATAAPKKKKVEAVVDTRNHTLFSSTDEDGKTRTRVIIQKRSYLDPGTETFPGENNGNGYTQLPNQRPSGVLDNTSFGNNQSALPNLWTLPGRSNPFIQF
jgi:hypothetical protein